MTHSEAPRALVPHMWGERFSFVLDGEEMKDWLSIIATETGVLPTTEQAEILVSDRRFVLVAGGEQAGKSVVASLFLIRKYLELNATPSADRHISTPNREDSAETQRPALYWLVERPTARRSESSGTWRSGSLRSTCWPRRRIGSTPAASSSRTGRESRPRAASTTAPCRRKHLTGSSVARQASSTPSCLTGCEVVSRPGTAGSSSRAPSSRAWAGTRNSSKSWRQGARPTELLSAFLDEPSLISRRKGRSSARRAPRRFDRRFLQWSA